MQPAPRVAPGATIGVCLPAGPSESGRFVRGLATLGNHFRVSLGAVAARTAGGQARTDQAPPYLAASDAERVDELNGLLRDSDVRAIVLGRGGYGLLRILSQLDAAAFRADPKPIVGLSDGIALLAWALAQGVRAIHGPMVVQLAEAQPDDVRLLVDVLGGHQPTWHADAPAAARLGQSDSVITGPVVGGNLCLQSHLVGTPWQIPPGLVLLEDVGERPYAIDRMLTHLHAAGALGHVGALVGDFTRCTEPASPTLGTGEADPTSALQVVRERLAHAGIPGLLGLPFGHGERNLSLPVGARAEMDLLAGTLRYVEGATD